GRQLDTALPDVRVERDRIAPERKEEDGAGRERQHDWSDRADGDVEEVGERASRGRSTLTRCTRLRRESGLGRDVGHAASITSPAPTISSPTRSPAFGPFSTSPTTSPGDSTRLRPQSS